MGFALKHIATNFLRIIVIMPMVLAVPVAMCAEEKKPMKTEKMSDKVARLIHADGTEEWDIAERGRMVFAPSPAQIREEPKPRAIDSNRGYITFSTEDRDGVLPDYRPKDSEISDKVSIFACSGEFEPATFIIRPLKDLGAVTFSCDGFVGPQGAKIPVENIDTYIVEPTAEQLGLSGNTVRWAAKWLRPGNSAKTGIAKNVQVYLDVHVPEDVKPGLYSGAVGIKPEKGKISSFTVQLEVFPLKLARPMSWGLFNYDWTEPEKRGDRILWMLKEMRRAGMTQCVISHIHYENSPGVNKDGSVNFSLYDRCLRLYQEAGFEDPPILAMEGLMCAIASAMGKTEELKFKDAFDPGVKAEDHI